MVIGDTNIVNQFCVTGKQGAIAVLSPSQVQHIYSRMVAKIMLNSCGFENISPAPAAPAPSISFQRPGKVHMIIGLMVY